MTTFRKRSSSTAIAPLGPASRHPSSCVGLKERGNIMTLELDEDDARLLYAVVIEKAQEHSTYANTSEVADRLCKLATRFAQPSLSLAVGKRSRYEL